MRDKIIVLGIVLVFLLSATVGIASALSNSGSGDWRYYKEITVKDNSGKTLTDYQVLVELNPVNFPATAKSDGSDLRFEDASGKELNYWIEDWDAGAKSAKIWVKVPSIPANGEAKIKMWYGNPSAGAVSDGDTTFEFFDDFDDQSVGVTPSGWRKIEGFGSFTVDDTMYISSPHSAKFDDTANYDALYMEKLFSEQSNLVFEVEFYPTNNYQVIVARDPTSYRWANKSAMIRCKPEGVISWCNKPSDYVYHQIMPFTQMWYKLKLVLKDGHYDIHINDKLEVSNANYIGEPLTFGIIQLCGAGSFKVTTFFDNFRIRKCTTLEPTTIKFSPEYPTAKPTPAATPTPVPTPIQEHIKFIVTPSGEGIYNISYTEYAPFTVNVLRYSDGNGVAGIPIYQLEPKEFEKATKEYLQRKAPDIIGTKLTERAVTKIIEKAGVDIISGPFGITIEVMSDIATLFDYLSYLTTPYIDLGAITDNEGKATLYLPNRAYTTTMDMSGFITQMDEPIDQTAPATQEQIAEQIASILLPTVQEELQPIAYKDITLAIPTKISIDDKGVITTETAEELKTYTEYHAINSKEVGNSRELTFWVEPRAIPPTTIGTGKEEEKMMKAHVLSQDRNLFPHVVSLSHYFQNKGIKCGYIDLIGHLADINEWVALNSPLESRWPSPEDDFTVVISSKEDKPKWKQTIKQFPQETVLQGSGWEVTKYTQTSADISGEHERFIFSIVVTDDEMREEAIKAFIENADPLGMPIEKEKEMPGFVAVFAVAGLLVVVYVLKRQK